MPSLLLHCLPSRHPRNQLFVRAGRRISLLRICLTAICVIASLSPAEGQEQPDASDTLPLYKFETGPIREWLILGPMVKGEELDDPISQLSDPQPGKAVTLPDGTIRRWQRVESDEAGLVALAKLNTVFRDTEAKEDTRYLTANQKVFYAVCKVKAEDPGRQILVGMDDGGKIWLDGEVVIDDIAADWLTLYEHAIPIPTHPSGYRHLLLELHNWTGNFNFQCYGGYRLAGRAVTKDGVTPFANEVLAVTVEGQPPVSIPTNAVGRFNLPAVPFGVPTVLEAGQSQLEIPALAKGDTTPPEDSELQFAVAPYFDLAIDRGRLPIRDGVYDAVIERRDGSIVLSNRSDHSIYVMRGNTARLHPDPRLHNFTNDIVSEMVEAQDGSLWMATHMDGIYCFDGKTLHHWPGEQTGKQNMMLHATHDGSVFASYRLELSANKHALYEFKRPGAKPDLIDVGNENPIWDAIERQQENGQRELLLIPRHGPIIVLAGSSRYEIEPEGDAQLTDATMDSDGNIWFAGNGILKLSPENDWSRIPVFRGDLGIRQRGIECGPEGEFWFVTSKAIYCLSGESIRRLPVQASASSPVRTCMTSTGQLLLTEQSGGVQSLSRAKHIDYDHTHGLTVSRMVYLSRGNKGIYASSWGAEPKRITTNGFQTDDYSKLRELDPTLFEAFRPLSIHCLSDGRQLAIPALHASSGDMHNTTRLPFLRNEDGNWIPLTCPEWDREVHTYLCCYELRDGRVFLSARDGLAELVGDTLEPSDLCREERTGDMVLAMHEDSDGVLWLVMCSGNILRVDGNESSLKTFPVDTHCSATAITEYDGSLWIGNSSGLFRMSKDGDTIEIVNNRLLRGQSIVSIRTDVVPGQLWVIGRHGTAYVSPDGDYFARLQIFDRNVHVVVNDTEVDDQGRLWLATESGLSAYRPTQTAPVLHIDSINGIDRIARGDAVASESVIEKSSRTVFRLLSRDDDRSAGVRYRINGGDWQYPEIDVSEPLQLAANIPGLRNIEFQAFDGMWNLSNVQSVQEKVYVPLLRRPVMRLALLLFAGAILAIGATLLRQNRNNRQAKNQLRERLLEEESRARARAEETNKERALLLARVCHDIRSPLSVVTLVRDMLEAETDEREKQQLIQLLDSSAHSMTYLTDQLLNYARSRTSMIQPELRPVPIVSFAEEFENVAKARLASLPVSFQLRLEQSLPDQMVTDPELLSETLNNVFENALKHTPKGTINLSCRLIGSSTIEWAVQDTGHGMSPDVVKSIFQPFFQGSAKADAQSVGLGMYIVHEVTRSLSGYAEVESEVGEGTTVRIRLPLDPDSQTEAEPENKPQDPEAVAA